MLDILPALVGPGDVADGVLHGLGGDVLEVAAALAVLLAHRGHEGEVGAALDELAPIIIIIIIMIPITIIIIIIIITMIVVIPLLAGQRAALEADRLPLHVLYMYIYIYIFV